MSRISEAKKAWKEYDEKLQALKLTTPPYEITVPIVSGGKRIGGVGYHPQTGSWYMNNGLTESAISFDSEDDIFAVIKALNELIAEPNGPETAKATYSGNIVLFTRNLLW